MSENINMLVLGQKIREWRKAAGMTQKELAEGVTSESLISQLENNSYPTLPNEEILVGICSKLGKPVSELFAESGIDKRLWDNEVLLDLIKVLLHQKDLDQAYESIQELMGRDNVAEHQKYRLTLCLGEYHIRKQEWPQTIEILTGLADELQGKREAYGRLLADLYNLLGTAWYLSTKYLDAYKNYSLAFQYSNKFHEPDLLLARITYNLGNTCRQLRYHEEAKEYLEKARTYFVDLADHLNLARSLYLLGIVHRNMDDFENAGRYLKQSLALYESLEIFEWVETAKRVYAFYVLSYDHPQEAIEELKSQASLLKDSKDFNTLALTYARIADLHLESKETSEAGRFVGMAASLFEHVIEAPNEEYFAHVLATSAKYNLQLNKFDDCIELAFKSAEILGKMDLDRDMAESLEIVKSAYKAKGDTSKALETAEQINTVLFRTLRPQVMP
ncbi:helix-turn-helix transcriptional regulator [Tumebacillus sp. ITR2]|uniref:Helix-turn-helix transcriptional regulator n=1 Tax=Tumebacillus amylolyticus TaxID=2801339 RepID=A0ABS1J5L5_9BACL|nr:helix-turn-helix transcriptional regulator [Tumebacillus amylolyticus]MBL0385555.1 helix-turn-helix transcriptional regulator [Tumebacillus amylolyticus]